MAWWLSACKTNLEPPKRRVRHRSKRSCELNEKSLNDTEDLT